MSSALILFLYIKNFGNRVNLEVHEYFARSLLYYACRGQGFQLLCIIAFVSIFISIFFFNRVILIRSNSSSSNFVVLILFTCSKNSYLHSLHPIFYRNNHLMVQATSFTFVRYYLYLGVSINNTIQKINITHIYSKCMQPYMPCSLTYVQSYRLERTHSHIHNIWPIVSLHFNL